MMGRGIKGWLQSFLDFDADQKPYKTRLDKEFAQMESYTVLAEDGTIRQKFRYVGEHYVPCEGLPAHTERLLCTGLFVLAGILFALSALRPDASNRCLYVIPFQGAAVVLFAFALISLVSYLTKPERLRDYEYRRCVHVPRRTTLLLMAALGAHAVGKLVYMCLGALGKKESELPGVLLAIGSALCITALFGILRKTSYRVVPPAEPKTSSSPCKTERK